MEEQELQRKGEQRLAEGGHLPTVTGPGAHKFISRFSIYSNWENRMECTPAAGSTKRGALRAPAASRRAKRGPCARACSALRAGRGAAGVSAGSSIRAVASLGASVAVLWTWTLAAPLSASRFYPLPQSACLYPAPESRIELRPAQQLLLVLLPRFASWCSAASPLRSQCLWVWREVPLSRSSSFSSSSCCRLRCLVRAHPDTPASRAWGKCARSAGQRREMWAAARGSQGKLGGLEGQRKVWGTVGQDRGPKRYEGARLMKLGKMTDLEERESSNLFTGF
ncbi:unnamed protein product [Rangifer tarandus platyrhynchus]|uniref:Uncharacterized protein n=2 Tax=Rangifer tarandus platyrhynchus TaxID=3082113 RepID=A0ABN8YD64_RANTA|nr:unnamed protein product [Rangifer tarandus platyrhynchus]CAI9699839.1 unnamed protein product [Rangifer tarandus platyrhynchus]